MQLIDIYALLERGEITIEEAATAMGMSVRNLKFRQTKWGHRLILVMSTLDRIRSDKITRDEAAQVLGITARAVNHLMNNWKVTRPLKQYLFERERAQVKWEVRKKFAIDYIAGSRELEDAADDAKVSPRQMRRWVSELLEKHYDMPFKDLKLVSNHRRLRLAEEIERSEGLEDAKQRVVDSIAEGKAYVQDVAVDRVLARKRRRPNV